MKSIDPDSIKGKIQVIRERYARHIEGVTLEEAEMLLRYAEQCMAQRCATCHFVEQYRVGYWRCINHSNFVLGLGNTDEMSCFGCIMWQSREDQNED